MQEFVDILGVSYLIKKVPYDEDPYFKKREIDGYCDSYSRKIVYCDLNTIEDWKDEPKETRDKCEKAILRHEIIHAFLDQSGLKESSSSVESWARNEEMVDWFSIQSPKIFEVFKKLELL